MIFTFKDNMLNVSYIYFPKYRKQNNPDVASKLIWEGGDDNVFNLAFLWRKH